MNDSDAYKIIAESGNELYLYDEEGRNGTIKTNINVNGGSFTMNGGSITGNSASSNGGGVALNGGTFTMNGGSITGNSVRTFGGGVYYENINGVEAAFSISGSPVITDNNVGSAASNVYLKSDRKITVSGALSEDASFGISVPDISQNESVVITAGLSGKGSSECFLSDAEIYSIGENSSGEALIGYSAFSGHRIILSSEIGVQFKIELPEDSSAENAYMDFVLSDGRTSSMTISEAEKAEDENAYWFTCCENALELADTITATFHDGSEKQFSNTYSALDYLNEINTLYPDDEKLIALADALQDYGHYMQGSGWTDGRNSHEPIAAISTIGNDEISDVRDAVSDMAVIKDIGESGLDIKYSLFLNEATIISVYADPGDTITKVEGAAYKGTRTIDGNAYYRYNTEKIRPVDLGTPCTVTVTSDTGTATIEASAMSYVYTALTGTDFTEDEQKAMTAYYNYYAVIEGLSQ